MTHTYNTHHRSRNQLSQNSKKSSSSNISHNTNQNTTPRAPFNLNTPANHTYNRNNPPNCPRVTITNREILEKRAKGLCFTYNEKWSLNHVCKQNELSVLLLIEGELELEEPENSIITEDSETTITNTLKLCGGLNQFQNNENETQHWRELS